MNQYFFLDFFSSVNSLFIYRKATDFYDFGCEPIL